MAVIPWKGAEIREGTIPQQGSLWPHPVILRCQDCWRTGYWYPRENAIDTSGRMCPDDGYGRWRRFHRWAVDRWNLNEPVEGAPESEL